MKLKDLPKNQGLSGTKVKTRNGVVGYWKSQWGYPGGKAGVWLSDGNSSQIYPQFVNTLEECLEWEVTEEEANCHMETSLTKIDMAND